ncbi:MAG: GNAT family N-acetyltransferase [Arthrobacter sp.]|uniref:Acetyltransferase n=1 Tax=Arthrobacter rhombi TaxID=71253 RepID=A0A1R4GWL6_9MICC|nr:MULTISPECIES: GNAT family N-acetyltransferase [Micrococcaceae]SJM72568.1 Acetyltransferase [Arthrobacter rhombi]
MLRRLSAADEEQALVAHGEMSLEGFDFLLDYDAGEDFAGYLAGLEAGERGEGLAPGRVPHTFLVAEDAGLLLGRVSLRHELTPMLATIGGHIGFGVRPGFRGRGYAGVLLAAALGRAAELGIDQVLVTCDETNHASAAVIERAGGIHEDTVELLPGHSKRRYWIATALV